MASAKTARSEYRSPDEGEVFVMASIGNVGSDPMAAFHLIVTEVDRNTDPDGLPVSEYVFTINGLRHTVKVEVV